MARRKLFIDIGANLTDPMFKGLYNGSQKHSADLDKVIERAQSNGIDKMIITGGSLQDSKNALDLARTNDALYSTVGCHPTRCLEFEADDAADSADVYLESLFKLASENRGKVVALGECGLDYDRLNFCPKDIQKKYFEKQLDIAEATKLPLFLHCRNAADDLTSILLKNKEKLSGGVVHSFDGTLSEALQFVSMGLYIGLNGCSLKTSENLEVVAKLPGDRILLETDCPWCEIKPSHASFQYIKTKFDSKKKERFENGLQVKGRNEPSNLIQVLEAVAGVRAEDVETLAETCLKNTEDLFKF